MHIKKTVRSFERKLNLLTLRERIIVFCMAVSVIVGLWTLIVFNSQEKWFIGAELKKKAELEQIGLFESKRSDILVRSQNTNVMNLIKQHGILKQQVSKVRQKMGAFKHEFVSPKELADMLYTMLREVRGIQLVSFESLLEDAKNIGNKAVSTSAASAEKVMLNRYRLVVKGEYLQILLYLQKLESIEWRLYWDKFDYRVETYPKARAMIDFYTLTNKTLLNEF